jgi:transcriptional regulator with XRE-family HTH domain
LTNPKLVYAVGKVVRMPAWGRKLRSMREQLGLTLRDVHKASLQLASRHRNRRLVLSPGRLSMIETKNEVPSIFRLYALSIIYRTDIKDLLTFYGLSR